MKNNNEWIVVAIEYHKKMVKHYHKLLKKRVLDNLDKNED